MDGIPVARLFGVEIRIHWSWVLILALVAVLAADGVGVAAPQLEPLVQWLIAALVAAGFLASAAAHDLGHAIVSRRRGIPVPSVAVSFFGGTSAYDSSATNPADEIVIAAAGPFVSLAVGVALIAISTALGALGGPALEAAGLFGVLLGVLNVLLGALNFVPAYPLDGGRLFRALVWKRTGDPRRGSRLVVRAGSIIGMLLLGAGLVVMAYDDLGNGLMVVLCGWFLRLTAKGVGQRLELEELADGLRAGDVMEPVGPGVSPGLTIDTFAEQVLDGEPPRGAVVVSRGDHVIGLVGIGQLRRLRRSSWPSTRVEEVMVPRERLPDVAPDTLVWPALVRLREAGLDTATVSGPEGLVGLLTLRSIAAALEARRPAGRSGLRAVL